MRRYILLLMVSFVFTSVRGQNSIAPGGIKGATHWYATDSTGNPPRLRSMLINNVSNLSVTNSNSSGISRLNFHPALIFSGLNSVSMDLGNRYFNTATFFTVYHSTDTSSENHIWNSTRNSKTELVLTTDRMADLTSFEYMNFVDVVRSNPKVNVYVQNKQKESLPAEQTIHLGNKPVSPELPINSFTGIIPEIIAYDRVLSSHERLQVASYLALKYGITLAEPDATYLNSAGEKIWNGSEYAGYHHDIAGMCRDDSSGLLQTMATSSNNPELLVLSTNQSFPNNTFLLWGENGLPLATDEKIPGVPNLLQKKWLMIDHEKSYSVTADIVFDTKQIDANLPAIPVYWLAIDRTGKGDFSLPGIEFYKMTMLDLQGKAHFNNVILNRDSSGKEVISFIAAQELLLVASIAHPTCINPGSGSLQVKILGGNPPYRLILSDPSREIKNQVIQNNNTPVSFYGIFAGKYFLKVIDAGQRVYSDSFYVNNSDAPKPAAIASGYVLLPGGKLQINAAAKMPDGLSYQWTGPNGFLSFSPQVVITQPGLYTLTCCSNGCCFRQDVAIATSPNNVFDNDIKVYPNPSTGIFTVKIALSRPALVKMEIFNEAGKLISFKELNGFANYRFTDRLTTSGTYYLIFRSGLSMVSSKLIIAK